MSQKKRKDRKDGKYISDMNHLNKILPYLLPGRTGNQVNYIASIDISSVLNYVKERKAIEGNNVTFFSTLMAAVVRIGAMRPGLNRFIKGYRFYQKNDFELGIIAKSQYSDDATRTIHKIKFEPSDDIFDVTDSIYKEINASRAGKLGGSNDTAVNFSKHSRFTNRFIFKVARFLDFHGWVPNSWISTDPYHSSIMVSNVGSFGIGTVDHHLTDWGTNSIILIVGAIYDKIVHTDNDGFILRPYVDLSFTIDDRVADGYYFGKSIVLLTEILNDPKSLEKKYIPNGEEK